MTESVRRKVVTSVVIQVAGDIHGSVGMTMVCSCRIVCNHTTSTLLLIWLFDQRYSKMSTLAMSGSFVP